MRRYSTLFSILLVTMLLTGCGKSAASDEGYYGAAKAMPFMANDMVASEAAYDDATAESYSDYSESDSIDTSTQDVNVNESAAANSGRKLIRNISMTVETTSYDELVNSIFDKVSMLGGYAENMDESVNTWTTPETRSMNTTIRVPKDKADELINIVTENANVTYRSENVEDVTLAYVDVESKKKSLQTEYDRLLELLDKAETIEEIITIEDRLSNVRYQLESQESQLRTYDNKVDYTTLRLNINEVERIVPVPKETFLSRISVGFMESVLDVADGIVGFVEWFIISLPYLVVWAVIIFLIWLVIIRNIVKKSQKRSSERKMKKAAEKAQKAKNAAENSQSVQETAATTQETAEETAEKEQESK